METDIIVEGFQKCIEQHVVKYSNILATVTALFDMLLSTVFLEALQLRILSVPIMLSTVFVHILRHLYLTIHAREEGEN